MGRPRKFTEQEFYAAYRKHHGIVKHISADLGCTVVTVYNYCKRMDLAVKVDESNLPSPIDVYNSYVGHQSVRSLSAKFDCSSEIIERLLWKGISDAWSNGAIKLPKPRKLMELKIAKTLIQNASLPIGKTIPITEFPKRLSVPKSVVSNYIERATNERKH